MSSQSGKNGLPKPQQQRNVYSGSKSSANGSNKKSQASSLNSSSAKPMAVVDQSQMMAEITVTTYDAKGKPSTTKVTARSSKEHFEEVLKLAVNAAPIQPSSTLVSDQLDSKEIEKKPIGPKSEDKNKAKVPASFNQTHVTQRSPTVQSPKTPRSVETKLNQKSPKYSSAPVQSPKTPRQTKAVDFSGPTSPSKDYARKNSWSKLKDQPKEASPSPSQNIKSNKEDKMNTSIKDQCLPNNTPVAESPDKSRAEQNSVGNDLLSTSLWISSEFTPNESEETIKSENLFTKLESADKPKTWVDEMDEFYASIAPPAPQKKPYYSPRMIDEKELDHLKLKNQVITIGSDTSINSDQMPYTPGIGDLVFDEYGHGMYLNQPSHNFKSDSLLDSKEIDEMLCHLNIKSERNRDQAYKEEMTRLRRQAMNDFKNSIGRFKPSRMTPNPPQVYESLSPFTLAIESPNKTPSKKTTTATLAPSVSSNSSPKTLTPKLQSGQTCQSAKSKLPQSELFFQFPSPKVNIEPTFYNLGEDPDSVFDHGAAKSPLISQDASLSTRKEKKNFGTQTTSVAKKVDFSSQTEIRYRNKPYQTRCFYNRRTRAHGQHSGLRQHGYPAAMRRKSERSGDSTIEESDDGVRVTLNLADYKPQERQTYGPYTDYMVNNPLAQRNQIQKLSQMQYAPPQEIKEKKSKKKSKSQSVSSTEATSPTKTQQSPPKTQPSPVKPKQQAPATSKAQKPMLDAQSQLNVFKSQIKTLKDSFAEISTALTESPSRIRSPRVLCPGLPNSFVLEERSRSSNLGGINSNNSTPQTVLNSPAVCLISTPASKDPAPLPLVVKKIDIAKTKSPSSNKLMMKSTDQFWFSNYGLDIDEEAQQSIQPNKPVGSENPVNEPKKVETSNPTVTTPAPQSVLVTLEPETTNKIDGQVYINARELLEKPSDLSLAASTSRASDGFVTAPESQNHSLEVDEKNQVIKSSSNCSTATSIKSQPKSDKIKSLLQVFEPKEVKQITKFDIPKLQTSSKSFPINQASNVCLEMPSQYGMATPGFDIDLFTLVASPAQSLVTEDQK